MEDLLQAQEVPRALHDRIEAVVQAGRDEQRQRARGRRARTGTPWAGARRGASARSRTATRRSSRWPRAARRRCRAGRPRRRRAWPAPGPASGICAVASVRIRKACCASASPRSRKPDSMTKAVSGSVSARRSHTPRPTRCFGLRAQVIPGVQQRQHEGRAGPPSSGCCGTALPRD